MIRWLAAVLIALPSMAWSSITYEYEVTSVTCTLDPCRDDILRNALAPMSLTLSDSGGFLWATTAGAPGGLWIDPASGGVERFVGPYGVVVVDGGQVVSRSFLSVYINGTSVLTWSGLFDTIIGNEYSTDFTALNRATFVGGWVPVPIPEPASLTLAILAIAVAAGAACRRNRIST